MLVVNGAGSVLAQGVISRWRDGPVLALSRGAVINQANVRSVNIASHDEYEEVLGQVDGERVIWVNFQTLKLDKLVTDVTAVDLARSFEVNVFRNFLAARVLIPKMLRKKFGSFIFVDSVLAAMGVPGCSPYATSKAATRALMKSIVAEYSRFGITCNTIGIGFADTPMFSTFKKEKKDSMLGAVPGKKFVEPSEVYDAIKFLVNTRSTNGQVLNLDGGLGMKG
jgi:3-oxoacyl-[acyl-carrier protein] reductase